MTLKKTSTLIFLFLPNFIFAATTLILENGDRISGEILSETATEFVVQHKILGKLTLARGVVARVEGEFKSPEKENVIKSPSNPQPDNSTVESVDTELPLWAKAVDWINPLEGWSSKLFLGYTWTGGESRSQDFLVQFTANQKFDRSNLKLKLRWDYSNTKVGTNPQYTTKDKYLADLRYRRDMGSRFFFQYEAQYRRDNVQNIDHRLDQNIGFGYKLINNSKVEASITPLLTLRYSEVGGIPDDWESLLTVEQEIKLKLTKAVTLKQFGKVTFVPHETQEADYQLEVILENKLSEQISLDLRYEYDFTQVVGFGVEEKAQRFIAGLGYTF